MRKLQPAHAYVSKEQQQDIERITAYAAKFGEGKYLVLPADIFDKEIEYYAGLIREAEFYKGTADGENRSKDVLVEKGCLMRLEILSDSMNNDIWEKAMKTVTKVRKEQLMS